MYLGCLRRTATHPLISVMMNSVFDVFPLCLRPNLNSSLRADSFYIYPVHTLEIGVPDDVLDIRNENVLNIDISDLKV